MNDFDDIIGGAVGARAEQAPHDRPAFGDVLDARQQRLRRRSVAGAVGVLAIGVTGMAAFAVGRPPESTADGPVDSEGPFATTTYVPGVAAPGESVWFCEGALDPYVIAPTTTVASPQTTIELPNEPDQSVPEASTIPDVGYLPPTEDSGYFRSCVMIEEGTAVVAPSDEYPIMTTTTSIDQYPTTTMLPDGQPVTTDSDGALVPGPTVTSPSDAQTYVVQDGDYPLEIADLFGVSLDDLLEFNGWTSFDEFPFPGGTISIPLGAVPATTTTSLLDE